MNKCFEKKHGILTSTLFENYNFWNNIHVHHYAWTEGGEYSYFWYIILTLKYTKYKHENLLNINTHIYMNIPQMSILLIIRLLLLDSFDKQIVKKFKLSHTANVIVNIKLNIKKPQRMINTVIMWYNRSNQGNMKDCCNYKNW